ncbi:hypothetical protein [Bowmanella sp. JS7-9]|uniref:Zinc-ribbon domain-containing protein n=1 Tax=Pseudobowmanella zhangzhouensis TaxID=1537679 RepID=A0ABW1XKU7_9ALTE|nr:hypothetical protein [Bowmanella sp. JS7-9]
MSTYIFVFWIIFTLIVAAIASSKGRSGVVFFILSAILSPLFGFIILLIIGEDSDAKDKEKVNTGTHKKCPFCAEIIKAEALLCKHCGSSLVGSFSPNANETSNIHRQLQNAIYEKDVDKVSKIVHSGIDLNECQEAFSHLEYAELHGNEDIIRTIKFALD